ncbi:MAG: class I SAM-dependent methyltransferase, partial [Saprospiraceae bacterium]|nr:class I SAM-dependent methyltransferase [Saprospiraceae bacterium]
MKIGHVFDEMINGYTQKMIRMVPHYQTLIELMTHSFPHPSAVRNVLELGAGNGNVSQKAIQKYPQAHFQLVDASEKMIHTLQSTFINRINIVYDLCLIQDCSFPVASFDLIIACFSLHHLSDDDKITTFKNVNRWLKPTGCFTYADLFID